MSDHELGAEFSGRQHRLTSLQLDGLLPAALNGGLGLNRGVERGVGQQLEHDPELDLLAEPGLALELPHLDLLLALLPGLVQFFRGWARFLGLRKLELGALRQGLSLWEAPVLALPASCSPCLQL